MDSFYTDHRVVAGDTRRPEFDAQRMVLAVEVEDDEGDLRTVEVPARFEVCGTCEGKGRHVNPSIDAHGIGPEEFDADPDFREDYLAGVHDVRCAECRGERVVPVPDREAAQEAALQAFDAWQDSEHQEARERAHERARGY